jgi:hypothetical protein
MKQQILLLATMAAFGVIIISGDRSQSMGAEGAQANPATSFFVTSTGSKTANLGGLKGADKICQQLASTVGLGNKTWHAYLSVERDPDNGNKPTDARGRIGTGPWSNAKGVGVAKNLDELHARKGDADVFLDEHGQRVPGNWPDSPTPVVHDILTGSTADGRLMAGKTCNDWTSASPDQQAQVGHSDGLGPGGDRSGKYSVWNSSHENGSCADTAPRGGRGRLYCFAAK